MKKLIKKNRHKKGTDSVLKLILLSFIKNNFICFTVIGAVYIICCLYAVQTPSFYESVYLYLEAVLNPLWADYICSNSYILLIPVFVCVIFINSIVSAVSTLINFSRVYKSINAFVREDAHILSFPKSYSDVELKLTDIHLKVIENRKKAIEAEKKKDDLVMYLAHDLKTPLTSVIGYLTLLNESRDLSTEQKARFVGISLEKAYRLEQLINEFFEITRFNINSVSLERNRIDLNMMLEQMADEFYPMLSEKSLTVHIDIPESIIIFADADKIARVFDNLFKNAVNYSYKGTAVKIAAKIRHNNVIIKFRNRCDEIPKEKLDRIFEKFYRMDSSRNTSSGGSGLGLAIARQITELHGGSISAESTPEYTDFTVVLPYVTTDSSDADRFDF